MTTTICVAVLEVIELTAVPPIVTAVAAVRLVPVIVTEAVPAQPLEGVKLIMVGAGMVTSLIPIVGPEGATPVNLVVPS